MEHCFSMKGRVAVVTGGNSGIGLGVAKMLASAGAQIVVAGRREDANAAAVAAIARDGGIAVAHRYDATREGDAEVLIDRAVAEFGAVHACVAAAGGVESMPRSFVDMTTDMWRGNLALNLDSIFFLYRAAVARMKDIGGGSLIAISSIASVRASPTTHYAAAKGAVNSLTINLSAQLGRYGIRVNAILPGPIETPPLQAFLRSDEMRAGMTKRIPVGRIGIPDDVAGLALYLASDYSTFVTGQLIAVDGGMAGT